MKILTTKMNMDNWLCGGALGTGWSLSQTRAARPRVGSAPARSICAVKIVQRPVSYPDFQPCVHLLAMDGLLACFCHARWWVWRSACWTLFR